MATLELDVVVGGLNARGYASKLTRTRARDQTLSRDHQGVGSFPAMTFGPCKLSGSHLGMGRGIAWARVCDLIGKPTPWGLWRGEGKEVSGWM